MFSMSNIWVSHNGSFCQLLLLLFFNGPVFLCLLVLCGLLYFVCFLCHWKFGIWLLCGDLDIRSPSIPMVFFLKNIQLVKTVVFFLKTLQAFFADYNMCDKWSLCSCSFCFTMFWQKFSWMPRAQTKKN